jgi:hypothetical protein
VYKVQREIMAGRKGGNSEAGVEMPDYLTEEPKNVFAQKVDGAEHNLRPETIIVAGSARLPEEVTAKHVFGCITIELEIDLFDNTIVDFACTLVPSLGGKILHSALVGSTVEEGIEKAITQLDRRFFNVNRRAVIAALEDAHRWYKKSLKKVAARNKT